MTFSCVYLLRGKIQHRVKKRCKYEVMTFEHIREVYAINTEGTKGDI